MSDSEDSRLQFDIDVEFSDGRGPARQRLRVSVEGEDISDPEITDYIVGELRSRLAGQVRIVDKLLQDPRKHSESDLTGGGGSAGLSRIDLSHTIEDGMITYRGLPAPAICDFLSHVESRGQYAPGTEFAIGKIEMCSNTGTYVDSPYHRYRDGTDLSELPLERLAQLDAVRVDVTGSTSRAISRAMLQPYGVGGKAVLLHTGWDRNWRTDAYFEGHPFLTEDAAEHLADEGAALVGIDSLNIDDTNDLRRPVHSVLLAAGVPICEHLTNLATLPVSGFSFSAVPLKIKAVGTFPVRAYAALSD